MKTKIQDGVLATTEHTTDPDPSTDSTTHTPGGGDRPAFTNRKSTCFRSTSSRERRFFWILFNQFL